MSVDTMTNKSGLRLKTSTVVTIPPPNITIILLEPTPRVLQYKSVNTELFEVIGNPLSSIEHPYLLILNVLHRLDSRYPEQCVVIAVNVSDEDIILNKDMTLCFVQETDLTMEILHAQDTDTVNMVNKEDKVDIKRETLENSLQKTSDSNKENCHKHIEKLAPIPENSAFIFYRDFYPKPRITLLDAELSPEMQQQLETLLKEFSVIMSKSSSDIHLTHLKEMVLHMKPWSIPVASKPYLLPLKHHKFIKEELTKLLEVGLIEWSISPYATPIMVVLH